MRMAKVATASRMMIPAMMSSERVITGYLRLVNAVRIAFLVKSGNEFLPSQSAVMVTLI